MARTRTLFLASLICLSCTSDKSLLTELFAFPNNLEEVSAIEVTSDPNKIWALQDSGNDPELYVLDKKGTITNTLKVTNVQNNDWEALASDTDGNLYIGDFGNNNNKRRDLMIHKINASDLDSKQASVSQTISFFYPEQKEFPPKKSNRIYDAEAFFYHKDNFYIFSKNRSSKFDGTTMMYKVPNIAGTHAAQLIGTFKACNIYKKCAITAADISPDGKTVSLLTATRIYLFQDFTEDNFLAGKSTEIDLSHFTQKEGICFASNSTIYIADEKEKKTGGKLYELAINN